MKEQQPIEKRQNPPPIKKAEVEKKHIKRDGKRKGGAKRP